MAASAEQKSLEATRQRRIRMAIEILEARREQRTLHSEMHPGEEIAALNTLKRFEGAYYAGREPRAVDELATLWIEASV